MLLQCTQWELTLVARKIGIMVRQPVYTIMDTAVDSTTLHDLQASFQFFSTTPAQSWLFGAMVIVTALLMHASARPYEDPLIDLCEFFR